MGPTFHKWLVFAGQKTECPDKIFHPLASFEEEFPFTLIANAALTKSSQCILLQHFGNNQQHSAHPIFPRRGRKALCALSIKLPSELPTNICIIDDVTAVVNRSGNLLALGRIRGRTTFLSRFQHFMQRGHKHRWGSFRLKGPYLHFQSLPKPAILSEN